jgi:gliding motility-associated-like protein
MNGPKTINDPGNYGTQGIASPANLPPSRWETSCSWADNTGNLWLYGGGSASNNWFGDLWKYNIPTNEWTWMHGSNVFNTVPVYGTQGIAASGNTPGGRYVYCSWNDLAGNLWLFAGEDSSMKKNNDLWKYDVVANQWTWMNGSNTTNDPGNYGNKCVTASSNLPPARYENRARVLDACGNFWNFGGNDNAGNFLNDLWHLNISTNQWTWVSGDNIPNQVSVYGTMGISAPANKLGARKGNTSWIDNNGYIWFFGGEGQAGRYNDLFRYVPDPTCVPVQTALVTASPNTTVCIGQSVTLNAYGNINYLWSPGGQTTSSIIVNNTVSVTYTITGSSICNSSTTTVTVTVIPPPAATINGNDTICTGENMLLTASGGINYLWNTGQNTPSIHVNPAITTVYTNTVSIGNCSATANFTVTVNPAPSANAWSNVTILAGSNTTLNSSTNSTGATYNWSPMTGLSCTTCTNPVAAPEVTTVYCITVTDSNNCADSTCVTVTVEDSCSRTGELYLPNAFSPNDDGDNDVLRLYYGNMNCIQAIHLIIYNRWGEQVFESSDPKFYWDGIYKGKKLNAAVFNYSMQATFISGEEIIRKGNISLTR